VVVAAGWSEAIELHIFPVPEFVDGEGRRLEGNLVAYVGLSGESPELGPFPDGLAVFVSSCRFCLVLGHSGCAKRFRGLQLLWSLVLLGPTMGLMNSLKVPSPNSGHSVRCRDSAGIAAAEAVRFHPLCLLRASQGVYWTRVCSQRPVAVEDTERHGRNHG